FFPPPFQYIFGEFSADEFNQFFVTPRCYVEVKTLYYNVLQHFFWYLYFCSGESYECIRFGVDEPADPEGVASTGSARKVSSTLNPQAPEFILGCQPAPKSLSAQQPGDRADFSSPDADGGPVLVGLEQRERQKKKKKRPPGYYSYLEGSGSSSVSHTAVNCAKATGLVNGHASVPSLVSENMLGEMESGVALPACGPGNSLPAGTGEVSANTGNQRTCESHSYSSLDLVSGTITLSDSSSTTTSLSSTSSHSSGAAATVRTAEQPLDAAAPETPDLLGRPGEYTGPASLPTVPSVSAVGPHAADTTCTSDRAVSRGPNDLVAHGLSSNTNEQGDSCEVQELGSQLLQQVPESPDSETQLGVAPAVPAGGPAGGPAINQPKSWASLFHNSKPLPRGPPAYAEVKNVASPGPGVRATAAAAEQVHEVNEVHAVRVSEDPLAPRLAELIENVKLIHKPVSLQPRGLINKGNWCYINATLQALVACPPMYHLLKSLSVLSEPQRPFSSTPMINNFVRLANEFSSMPVPPKAKMPGGDKMVKDIRPGVPFEPDYIYRLLTVIKSSLSERGRQEDAEEYLGYILNGLHEEMLALKKLLLPQEEKVSTLNGQEPQSRAEEDMTERQDEGSDDEWEQVGPRNKTSVTRQADFVRTPITDIFCGHIRSVVYQQSSKESATLQPFFTLQLDIQSEKIHTVQEALESLGARESVQGYTSRTKHEIEISRRVTLEELPPVLVLHLKRFVFEKTGGCQKLVKNIDYPVDLEISKDLLSPGVRSKIFKGQRTYRLFAVVYHHGNRATGGHYTTDVFHIGLNGWLRIDDQAVKVVSQYQVLKQSTDRAAYLLYYRRMDLL
ncbi:ubiquitin carboxyl-terminal hydrolase 10-like isoform X2, partial [Arapaima gigas]